MNGSLKKFIVGALFCCHGKTKIVWSSGVIISIGQWLFNCKCHLKCLCISGHGRPTAMVRPWPILFSQTACPTVGRKIYYSFSLVSSTSAVTENTLFFRINLWFIFVRMSFKAKDKTAQSSYPSTIIYVYVYVNETSLSVRW